MGQLLLFLRRRACGCDCGSTANLGLGHVKDFGLWTVPCSRLVLIGICSCCTWSAIDDFCAGLLGHIAVEHNGLGHGTTHSIYV